MDSLTYKKFILIAFTALVALLAACTPTGGNVVEPSDDASQVYLEGLEVLINLSSELADGW